jgi:hypothetical protein
VARQAQDRRIGGDIEESSDRGATGAGVAPGKREGFSLQAWREVDQGHAMTRL